MGLFSHEQDGSQTPQQSGLKLLRDCPVCQTNFQQSDIRVVDTYQQVHLLHVTCSSCSHSILSLFMISELGLSSVGMATDLSATDAERVLGTTPIHEDELLAFHAFLEGTPAQAKRIEDLFITQHKTI